MCGANAKLHERNEQFEARLVAGLCNRHCGILKRVAKRAAMIEGIAGSSNTGGNVNPLII
jgi:hypothetical protein